MSMKLTVGQFLDLYKVANSELEREDKIIQNAAILTGKTDEEVNDMSVTEVNQLSAVANEALQNYQLNTKPVSFLRSGRKLYQVNYKPGTLRAGQNTELQHWLKEKDWIKNMDKILASVVVPCKRTLWWYLPTHNRSEDHEKVASYMREVDFSEAYGCVVFFCKVFAASIKGILPSLEKQMLSKGKTLQEIRIFQTDLMKTLDGFITQSG